MMPCAAYVWPRTWARKRAAGRGLPDRRRRNAMSRTKPGRGAVVLAVLAARPRPGQAPSLAEPAGGTAAGNFLPCVSIRHSRRRPKVVATIQRRTSLMTIASPPLAPHLQHRCRGCTARRLFRETPRDWIERHVLGVAWALKPERIGGLPNLARMVMAALVSRRAGLPDPEQALEQSLWPRRHRPRPVGADAGRGPPPRALSVLPRRTDEMVVAARALRAVLR